MRSFCLPVDTINQPTGGCRNDSAQILSVASPIACGIYPLEDVPWSQFDDQSDVTRQLVDICKYLSQNRLAICFDSYPKPSLISYVQKKINQRLKVSTILFWNVTS